MIATESKTIAFIESFKESNLPVWNKFTSLRAPFLKQLETQEFPTTRDEYWKYIRTTKIAKSNYSINNSIKINNVDDYKIKGLDCYQLVLINGFIASNHSELPSSDLATIKPFADCDESELAPYFSKELKSDNNIFVSLNSAYFTSGIFINIIKNLDKPFHIINILSGENIISQPRKIVVANKHTESTFVESFHATNSSNILQNGVNEIFVEENSFLNYINIQAEEPGVFHVNNTQAHQDKNSIFSTHHYATKGDWIRNNTNILVNGENCESNMYGAYQAKENQAVDNHTIVDHRVPNCVSNELYKGTVDDKATVTFNGKVFVQKDAQKINAFQSNNNILLSDNATINSKPELEIYADDVKCSHGSTTGQLDEDALFYLRSRGLSTKGARQLLVGAFVGEVIEHIKVEPVKDYVKTLFGLID
jgi:Fe-S cluster assembly protein SufD